MNFQHMPELKWRFGYAVALGLIAAISGYLYYRFRRAGWVWPRVRGRSGQQEASRRCRSAQKQHAAVDLPDVGAAAEGHREIEFLVDDLQRARHARLAHGAQAVEERAADVGAAWRPAPAP